MRIHLKTLTTIHRTRFQLKRAHWDALAAQGLIKQSQAVHRVVAGVCTTLPQQWTIRVLNRDLPLSNLGHGWFETTIGRKADHFEDLTCRALHLSIRPVVQRAVGVDITPVHVVNEVRWGNPVTRDPQKISRGLNPDKRDKVNAAPEAGQTITSKLYSEPPKRQPMELRPPNPEKLAHLCARFNRTKDRA